MKKFIVIYRVPDALMAETANTSPEDRAKSMEAWHQWAKQCGDKLVDMGSPLAGGQRLSPDGSSTNSKMEVAGYSVLQAGSMDEAKKLLKGHPHLAWDGACSIEVHEALPLPGM